jgi:hypothetical protein
MTKKDQRIAIAEACGWKWYKTPRSVQNPKESQYRTLCLPSLHEHEGQSAVWLQRAAGVEKIANLKFMVDNGRLPDFPNDLNAMHGAWMLLNEQDQCEFRNELDKVVHRKFPEAGKHRRETLAANATAADRAEAFLRLIGKWR